MTYIPPQVQQQWEAFQFHEGSLTREEAELLYPDLLNHIRATVSIVDLICDSGFEMEPLSSDIPDVFVAKGGCPSCGSDVFLKDK